MPVPIPLPPDEALESITSHSKEPRAVELNLVEASGAYLLETIEGALGDGFPGDPPDLRRATEDGYALLRPAARGDAFELHEQAATRASRPDGASELAAASIAFRVALGEPLPADVVAIAPARSVILTEPGRLRVEVRIEAGAHVAVAGRGRDTLTDRGTLLGARLAAQLLAGGRERVQVGRRVRVGVVYLGQDLEPLRAERSERSRAPIDTTSHWLPAAARAGGFEIVEVGRGCDGVAEFRRAFQRAHARRVDLLLLVGGAGDGVSDRAAEWLVRIQGDVRVERVALDLAPSLIWGKITGMDVLGIGGAPRASAIGWDLFVHPYLLRRAGASRAHWDWRLSRAELVTEAPLDRSRWELRAARRFASSEAGAPGIEAIDAGGPFSPWAPGLEGWALVPPGESSGASDPAAPPCGDRNPARASASSKPEPNTGTECRISAFWCALTASERGL